MENKCIVLDLAHSASGEATILDFPPNFTPFLGMKLYDAKNHYWLIKGMGLPVIIETLKEKIPTHYNSNTVWDCFLVAVDHKFILTKGIELFYNQKQL